MAFMEVNGFLVLFKSERTKGAKSASYIFLKGWFSIKTLVVMFIIYVVNLIFCACFFRCSQRRRKAP
jgi:hypothetical protein